MIKMTINFAIYFFYISSANAALIQVYQGTGTYGLEVAAVGYAGGPAVGGTINLATMPAGVTPIQAYLYAYDTNHFGTISATFNGSSLLGGTAIGPLASDSAFTTLSTFRWDVTSQIISGLTSYNWGFSETISVNQGNNIGMTALAVVYQDPSLPTSVATIYDGMTYVGNTHPETETINMTGLSAGLSKIYTVTYQDDNFTPPTSSGETIVFNSNTIGGPLDRNLAFNGSLTQMTGTAVSGTNALSITTGVDEFGWTLAATLTPVPVPGALLLFISGLAGLFGLNRVRGSARHP